MPQMTVSPRARNLRRAAWGPPGKGLNKQAVPLAVPDDQAPILQNYLTDEVPGAISSRPGMVKNGVIKYIVYTGDQLPQNSSPPFTRTSTGGTPTTEEISPASQLHVVTAAGQQLYWDLAQSYLSSANGTVFRMYVKVDAMTVAGNKGWGCFIDDGTNRGDLRIQQDGTAFFVDAAGAQVGGSVAFSFGVFHLVAVTLTGTTLKLYLDDMTTSVLTGTVIAGTTSKRVLFGDADVGTGTTEVHVDYAEWWVGTDPSAPGNTTTASIRNLYEYRKADGTLRLLALSADELYSSTGDGNFGVAVKTGLNSSFESSLTTFKDLVWHTNGTDNIFTWDGTTATDRTGGSLASKGRYIIAHHGRLWHMGTSGDPSSIFFSEIDLAQNADPGNAANWPATNQFYVGRDDGDRITGPRVYNDALVIFKRNTIWVHYGFTPVPGQSNTRAISIGIGCPNSRTAREWQGNLVFLANDGILRMITPQWAVVKAPHAEENRVLTEQIQQTQAVERGYSRTTQADWDAGTKTGVSTTNVVGAVTLPAFAAGNLVDVNAADEVRSLIGTSNTWLAQSWTNPNAGVALVDSVRVRFQIGYDLTVTAKLYSDTGGSPGTLLATSGSATISRSGTSQEGTINFSTPVSVASGATTWLVLVPLAGLPSYTYNSLVWLAAAAYSGGRVKSSTDGGSTWLGTMPDVGGAQSVDGASYDFARLVIHQAARYEPTTGSWVSPPIDTGGSLSQWGTLTTDQQTPASTTLAWQYKTATTSAGLATAAYQSITPGSQIISALANRYLQLKVTLTTTDVTQSPLVEGLTLLWFESGLPSMPPDSVVFNGRYYLSVAALGSTTNNKVIVLDRHGAMHEWTGWNYHSLVEFKRELYGGSSTSTEIDRLLASTSDNGTAITTDWRTNESLLGVPDLVKWFKRVLVTLKNLTADDLTIGYSIDRGAFTTRTVTTTIDGTVKQAELILPMGTRGRVIQLQVTTSTKDLAHQVFGIAVDYEPLPGRIL